MRVCECGDQRGETLRCWGPCGKWYHAICATGLHDVWRGPMICLDCRAQAHCDGHRDFLSDEDLMQLVVTGDLPPGLDEAAASKLVDAAEHLRWDGSRLWFKGGEGVERQVPPRWRRP